ncbi:beta-galactosidase [Streptomyces longwoodensis]|uniref:beta-galactosidase n=1 Tax=Streptomyces longwoodensis TaxID=68231 RepID=UPI0033FE5104
MTAVPHTHPPASRLPGPPGLLYGGDYNPEQWPEEVWAEDARLMGEAGVTMVTVGVFAWARLQPAPDRWDFAWLDRVMDLLHQQGVAVDLATATAAPPAWLVRAHPEMLPVTADGVRLEFGSRQHYCPSSPIYRAAATDLVRALAERYRGHPALTLWHVNNEYGDHVTECFCPESAAGFRRWLKRRYRTVETLNTAWGTTVWSQAYSSFSQIEPPRTAPGPVNPTHRLDWRRYSSDVLLECYRAEKEVLDELSPHVPVTTNFMSMLKELDYWAWAAHEDIVSDDSYPDPADPKAHIGAAMNYDLMRSLGGGRPWLLMEQAPSAVSWREVNLPKPERLRRLWSLQALARGADGILHFQWRASAAGPEKFHSAMLPHRGTRARGWAHTVRMGTELRRLAEVGGTRLAGPAAVVLDWESWWSLEGEDHPSRRMRWPALLRPWYEALFTRGVTVDFVPPGADLGGRRIVLAPNLHMVDDAGARWLADFAMAGGHVVCGPFSGVVDRDDHIHPGGPPGPLAPLLGVAVDEVWPIPDGGWTRVEMNGLGLRAALWSEWLDLEGAVPVASYTSGELTGLPAVTRRDHGAGAAWYIGCHLGSGTGAVLAVALAASGAIPGGPQPPPAPGVEVTRRVAADGTSYLFLLNHGQDTAHQPVTAPGVDLLTGTAVESSLTLAPSDAAVIRTSPQRNRT